MGKQKLNQPSAVERTISAEVGAVDLITPSVAIRGCKSRNDGVSCNGTKLLLSFNRGRLDEPLAAFFAVLKFSGEISLCSKLLLIIF